MSSVTTVGSFLRAMINDEAEVVEETASRNASTTRTCPEIDQRSDFAYEGETLVFLSNLCMYLLLCCYRILSRSWTHCQPYCT